MRFLQITGWFLFGFFLVYKKLNTSAYDQSGCFITILVIYFLSWSFVGSIGVSGFVG